MEGLGSTGLPHLVVKIISKIRHEDFCLFVCLYFGFFMDFLRIFLVSLDFFWIVWFFLDYLFILGFFFNLLNFFYCFGYFWFLAFLSKLLSLLLNVTKVTTGHPKFPKMGQNRIISSFFAQRAKKVLTEGRSPPQELELGPHIGPYLLVLSVLGLDLGYTVKYTPPPSGVPWGFGLGNSLRRRGIFDRISLVLS